LVRGLYTCGVGMSAALNKFDVVANNLANVDTTGYKKDGVITQSFSEELLKRLDDPNQNQISHNVNIGRMRLGVFVDTIFTDFSQGEIINTGNELDVAITGDGFFAISAPDRDGNYIECYTRDGSFTIGTFDSDERILLTKSGFPVLGQNGYIPIHNGEFVVDRYGEVFIEGELIDTLRIVSFEDNQTLRKYKDNLYVTTEESREIPFEGYTYQNSIEMSNVVSMRDMVEVITVNRLYESMQRVITTIDQTLGRAVSDIARR